MTAHHFFVEEGGIGEGVVRIEGPDARHASRVLRVRPGERITVADGSGRVVAADVTRVGRDHTVEAEIRDESQIEAPRPRIAVFQALTKREKIDEVVEKATEIGVRRVVPFVSERSVVRWEASKRESQRERWCAIARAAAKQCRSPWLTVVDPVAEGPEAVLAEPGPKIALDAAAGRRLRQVLPAHAPEDLALVVGPEGGLSDREIERLGSRGAEVVSLGPRILRTETAGPAAAAVVAYTYGWLG